MRPNFRSASGQVLWEGWVGRQVVEGRHPCGKDLLETGRGWWGAVSDHHQSRGRRAGLSSVHQLCVGVAPDGANGPLGWELSGPFPAPFLKGMTGMILHGLQAS